MYYFIILNFLNKILENDKNKNLNYYYISLYIS